jgi:hypothetical protein
MAFDPLLDRPCAVLAPVVVRISPPSEVRLKHTTIFLFEGVDLS